MPNPHSVIKEIAVSDPKSVSGQKPKGFLQYVTLGDRGALGAAQRCFGSHFCETARKNGAYAGCRQV